MRQTPNVQMLGVLRYKIGLCLKTAVFKHKQLLQKLILRKIDISSHF